MPSGNSLIRPRLLRPGDVIRVVAPASPFKEEDLQAGVERLESWGYRVRMQDDITSSWHYLAGSPQRRADELHAAFADREAAAILPVRGGYGLTTLLPLLDPKLIRANPKILVGCSDLTALLQWMLSEVGMACFHGPMLGALGRGADPAGIRRFREVLENPGKPAELHSAFQDAHQWCFAPGVAKGHAMGGSLSLLAALCGTPLQPDTTGAVLFLEDVGERPYRIDRLLTQLQHSGLFDRVEAVVLGDFVGCDEPKGEPSWRDAVDRVFRSLPIPVLAGLPFGHGNPNLIFPLGTKVQVDAGRGLVEFRESPLVS